MKRKLEASELIFKIISYTLLLMFSLICLYPFLYAISAAVSGRTAVEYGQVILFPKDVQFQAFQRMFNDNMFWNAYSNTLFLTFYGTIWALFVAILGGYALSKRRLLFRRFFNFFLVFTMWFSAGLVPQHLNYLHTKAVFNAAGITDDKWLVVIAMGMAAMNIILLRNAFEGVPSEIEEAAIVDGATEFQVLTKVFIPMCKSTIATVALFFAISRWNGYFWAQPQRASPAGVHPPEAGGVHGPGPHGRLERDLRLRLRHLCPDRLLHRPHPHHLPLHPEVLRQGRQRGRRQGVSGCRPVFPDDIHGTQRTQNTLRRIV